MIYGLIDRNIHEHYTYMSTIFQAIKNKQTQYNWLNLRWQYHGMHLQSEMKI